MLTSRGLILVARSTESRSCRHPLYFILSLGVYVGSLWALRLDEDDDLLIPETHPVFGRVPWIRHHRGKVVPIQNAH